MRAAALTVLGLVVYVATMATGMALLWRWWL